MISTRKTLISLNNHGIDTEGLQIKQGEKSFFWSGKYHNDMNSRDTLITELNVLADFDPVIPESYQDCEYLMLANLDTTSTANGYQALKKQPKADRNGHHEFLDGHCDG